MREARPFLSLPFHRRGDWGPERLCDLPKVKHEWEVAEPGLKLWVPHSKSRLLVLQPTCEAMFQIQAWDKNLLHIIQLPRKQSCEHMSGPFVLHPPWHSGLTRRSPLLWSPWSPPRPPAEALIPWTLGHLSHCVVVIWCHLPWALLRVVNLWIKSQERQRPQMKDWPNIYCHGNGYLPWPLTRCLGRWASRRKQRWLRASLPGVIGGDDSAVKRKGQAGGQPWMVGTSVKVLSFLKSWGFLKCRDRLSAISASRVEPGPALSSVQ